MSIGLNAIAAAAATVMMAGVAGSASAQPEYGYGQLPPAPYQEAGGYGGGSCGRDSFTLVGAHAGVTVLGVDLDAGARLGVPYDSGCSGGGYEAQRFEPRPQAPQGPVAYGYAPQYQPQPQYQPYSYQGYAAQSYEQSGYGYAPMPEGPPPVYYGSPCGCSPARGW